SAGRRLLSAASKAPRPFLACSRLTPDLLANSDSNSDMRPSFLWAHEKWRKRPPAVASSNLGPEGKIDKPQAHNRPSRAGAVTEGRPLASRGGGPPAPQQVAGERPQARELVAGVHVVLDDVEREVEGPGEAPDGEDEE